MRSVCRERNYIVIDALLKNEVFLRWFPLGAGVVFIAVFISLGMWQLDRAREKEDLIAQFGSDAGFVEPHDWSALADYDHIKVFGRYRNDRQILIDNIVLEGRLGYYVITPFETSTTSEWLLINRGWLPKPVNPDDAIDLTVDGEFRTVLGMAGGLPRVAIRPGEAFVERGEWPMVGVYPTSDEVAAELGQFVLPRVLLLHPDAEEGFVRRWEPNISGPMTHYSYAFQWFAMAVAAAAIMGWQLSKRFAREQANG